MNRIRFVFASSLLCCIAFWRWPDRVAHGAAPPRPTADQYQSYAMAHLGDAARGKTLFFDELKLACARCHAVEAARDNPKVGPPLFAVGDKFGRRDLIESILAPSASIAVGYSATTVRTRSGDLVQGVVRESTGEALVLMQSDGKLARIPTGDVRRQRTSDVSLMPDELYTGLTPQEFADLVEYLASLRLPESVAATGHGMPPTIPELQTPVALRPFTSEQFEKPVWFGPVPGVVDTFAVEEHESGRVWFLTPGGGADRKTLFADTGRFLAGTRGLVGLAFHAKFGTNGKYYFTKHLVADGHFHTVVYRGRADAGRTRDSGQPPVVLLDVDMSSNVHFGGGLCFGPDGYLYVGIGDTGPQGDPHGNAQNPGLVAGKILRIDVDREDAARPYSIPPDNPFVNTPGTRPEVWATGLRMAWRFSFDPLTGELWEADVGQDLFEEVNLIRRGGNYGWNVFEGFEPYSNSHRRERETYLPPVFAYTRKYGASVTGGFVYRGDARSSFYGVYVFGDYQSGRLFGLTQKGGVLDAVRQIGTSPQHPVSIGRDERGNLYVVGYEGTIYSVDLSHAEFK